MDNKKKLQIASVQCAEELLRLTMLELETGKQRYKVRIMLDTELILHECTKMNMN